MKIYPRETVILAENFQSLVDWYQKVLHFKKTLNKDIDYHYCNLENENGIRIGIGDAKEMGVSPKERKNNPVILQFQVPNVKDFFDYLKSENAVVTFGPSLDKEDNFWFGGFEDLEGNPIWVVDEKCP